MSLSACTERVDGATQSWHAVALSSAAAMVSLAGASQLGLTVVGMVPAGACASKVLAVVYMWSVCHRGCCLVMVCAAGVVL